MHLCDRCKYHPCEYQSDFCGECHDIMAWWGMGADDTICTWQDCNNVYERMKNGETWQQVHDDYMRHMSTWADAYADMERNHGYKFGVGVLSDGSTIN